VTRWAPGAERVQQLIGLGDLQKVQGGVANGQPLLDKAARTLASASTLRDADPDSSYTLAYDAARFACTALLAQQGLRPTTKGGSLCGRTGCSRPVPNAFPDVWHAPPAPQRAGISDFARRWDHLRGGRRGV
jgi:hypothetical protein